MAAENNELGSKLGFDVSAAVASLNTLKRQFDAYSASLEKVAGSTETMNAQQLKVDDLLKRSATSAQLAAAQLKQFATATNAAEVATRKFIQTRQKLDAASFGARPLERGPLSGIVDNVNQGKADQAAKAAAAAAATQLTSIRQRLAVEKQLADAEKQKNAQVISTSTEQLRRAFGRAPQIPLAGDLQKQGEQAKSTIRDLGISWTGLLKIFATQIIFRGLSLVTSQFSEAVAAARKFEIQVARIQTISQEFAREGLDATADAVRNLSDQFGNPIGEVAAGLYEAISNQVGNAAESVNFLNESLKFSIATGASAADSVDLLSGVINSFGLTASSTQNIADQLFVTIDRGRVKASDLANTFGRILPIANTLGIGLDDINAAVAELTIQGVNPADALTQLTNVMLKLVKPSEALQNVFNNMGIASAEAGIATFGFDGFLRELTKDAKGSATEITELFNQIRGTRGVIGIVTRDSAKYAETLREIRKASEGAGASTKAFNLVNQTPAQELQRQITQLKNSLIDDFARPAIAFFTTFVTPIVSLKTQFLILASSIAALGAVLGTGGLVLIVGQAIGAFATLTATVTGYNFVTGASVPVINAQAAALATRLAPAARIAAAALSGIAIGTGLAVGLGILGSASDQVGKSTEAIKKFEAASKAAAETEKSSLRDQIEARKKAVTASVALIEKDFQNRQRAYLKDKEAAFQAQESITQSFKDQLAKRQDLINELLTQLSNFQRDAGAKIQDLQRSNFDTQFQDESNKFERRLKDVGDPQQIATFLISRSQAVLQAAKSAANAGDTKLAEDLFRGASDLANRAADTQGQRARGEAQVNNVLREQESLNRQLIKQESAKAAAAKAAETANRVQLTLTAQKIDRFNEINKDIANEQLKSGKDVNQNKLGELIGERGQLAKEIQASLSAVSVANIPALKSLIEIQRQLQQPFVNPVNGALGSLTTTAEASFKTVLDKLTEQARKTPIDIQVRFKALTGQDIGVEGFKAGQNAAAKLGKDVKTGIENEVALPDLQKQLDDANNRVNDFFNRIKTTGRDASVTSLLFGKTSKTEFDANITDFNAKVDALKNRVQDALKQASVGNVGPLKEVLAELNQLKETSGDAGKGNALQGLGAFLTGIVNPTAGSQLEKFFGKLETSVVAAAEATQKLQTAQSQQANNSNIETALTTQNDALLNLLGTLGRQDRAVLKVNTDVTALGPVTTTAISTANQEFAKLSTSSAQSQVQALIDKIKALNEAQQGGGGGTATPNAQGIARGGPVSYLAGGGFVPRGTDTIPAMLSKGEFVIKASSARKFYSELVAINAGVRPVYRAAGGPVTNHTVGDVHVNVNTTGRVNGREIANELRRELRRQTSRL